MYNTEYFFQIKDIEIQGKNENSKSCFLITWIIFPHFLHNAECR